MQLQCPVEVHLDLRHHWRNGEIMMKVDNASCKSVCHMFRSDGMDASNTSRGTEKIRMERSVFWTFEEF